MKSLCLAGLALALVVSLAGCSGQDSAEIAAIEDEIAEIEAAVQEARAEKKQLADEMKGWDSALKEVDSNGEKAAELQQELAQWKGYKAGVAAAEQQVEEHLEVWRTFVRQRLVGRDLGNVLLEDNSVLQGASVVSLNEEEVVLQHRAGETTVPYQNLPEEVLLQLFHEPTLEAIPSPNLAQ